MGIRPEFFLGFFPGFFGVFLGVLSRIPLGMSSLSFPGFIWKLLSRFRALLGAPSEISFGIPCKIPPLVFPSILSGIPSKIYSWIPMWISSESFQGLFQTFLPWFNEISQDSLEIISGIPSLNFRMVPLKNPTEMQEFSQGLFPGFFLWYLPEFLVSSFIDFALDFFWHFFIYSFQNLLMDFWRDSFWILSRILYKKKTWYIDFSRDSLGIRFGIFFRISSTISSGIPFV